MRLIEFIKTQYIESFNALKENRMILFISFIADILFLFTLGFVQSAFGEKITEYAVHLGFLASSRSGELTQEYVSKSIPELLSSNPEISAAVSVLFFLFLFLAISILILFVVLESISFRIITRAAGYEVGYARFFKQFSIISGFWFLFMLVYWIVSYLQTLTFTLSNRMTLYESNIWLIVYLLVLFYFAMISFSLIGAGSWFWVLKKTLVVGFRKAHYLAVLFFTLFILYIILNFIIIFMFSISQFFSMVLGFVLVIPAFIFARVVVVKAVRRLI